MKRFVIAGLFIVLGFIILGVATANLMSGPDKPANKRPVPASAANGAPKPQRNTGADANVTQPTLPSTKPPQSTAANGAPPTQSPGMPPPLTTVQPAAVHPPPQQSPPHVPIIQPTDIGTPSSPTAGRQHQ
jgi:type IV secretory pathway VirB10-like protein